MTKQKRLKWDACQKQLDPEQCSETMRRPSGMPAIRELLSFKGLSEV